MIASQKKKVRVAFIFNHSYFLGGGEISFFELIKKLDTKWLEPVAIVPEHGEIESKLLENKIDVHTNLLPEIKSIYKGLPFIALNNFYKLLKEKEIEIIHANGSRACLYAGIVGKILNIPIIWHVRETIKDIFWYDGFLGILASRIICVSRSVKNKRFTRFGVLLNKKISIIYNGVDTLNFKKKSYARYKIRKALKLDGKILFGIIGNFVPLKGQDEFLKGIAMAKQKIPDISVKALLIGRSLDYEYHKSLIEQIEKLNLQKDIILMDYTPKIIDIISALDVFVLPSKREGFSRAMLEAMSCRLPIIASKIEEIEEAVVNSKNGILINISDIEDMADAIIRLYKNSSLREQMGVLNRKIVKKRFNETSHIQGIELIYKKIVAKKSSASCD